MNRYRKWACIVLAIAMLSVDAFAQAGLEAGRQVFVDRCRTCHGGTGPPDIAIGPQLNGVFGAKAGTRPGGITSSAVANSGVVWNRDTLRGFLATPRSVISAAMMPDEELSPAELEALLDYLESLQ